MMKDCYNEFHHKGVWTGKGDVLEDPWLEPSSAELQLRMHTHAEGELRKNEEKAVILSDTVVEPKKQEEEPPEPAQPKAGGGMRRSVLAVVGAVKAKAKVKANAKGKAKAKSRSSRDVSNGDNLIPRSQPGTSEASPARPKAASKASAQPRASSERVSVRGRQEVRIQEEEEEAAAPAPVEEATPAPRPAARSPGRRSAPSPAPEPAPALEPEPVPTDAAPLMNGQVEEQVVAPERQPSSPPERVVISEAPMPGPTAEQKNAIARKDTFIAVLREQLKDKDDKEEQHKRRIEDLAKQLQLLEEQHGPLSALVEAVEEKMNSGAKNVAAPDIKTLPTPMMTTQVVMETPVAQTSAVRRFSSRSPVPSRSPAQRVPGGVRPVQVSLSPPPLAKTVGWTMQNIKPQRQLIL